MGQPKEQQNAPMWQELDGLRHQTVGQLKVECRAVLGQESRSRTSDTSISLIHPPSNSAAWERVAAERTAATSGRGAHF